MKYQIYWSEDVNPELTEEQKEEYRNLKIEQVYPVGDIVNNRRLFHAIATKEIIDEMLEFISFKNPKIKNITNKDNIKYGYKLILVSPATDDVEAVYEIVRDENIETLYDITCNTNFFLEHEIDVKGEMVTMVTPKHSFAGWKII